MPLLVCGNGLVIVIHAGRFQAVQLQLGCAVTFTVKVAPALPNDMLVGETVELGQHEPADCDILNAAPAMVSVALSAGPLLARVW